MYSKADVRRAKAAAKAKRRAANDDKIRALRVERLLDETRGPSLSTAEIDGSVNAGRARDRRKGLRALDRLAEGGDFVRLASIAVETDKRTRKEALSRIEKRAKRGLQDLPDEALAALMKLSGEKRLVEAASRQLVENATSIRTELSVTAIAELLNSGNPDRQELGFVALDGIAARGDTVKIEAVTLFVEGPNKARVWEYVRH